MATETETTRTEHPHIVMTPGVCGGRPRVDGTRLSVEFIVRQVAAGDGPQVIAESYPDGYVTAAAVYDALSYYHDHKEEMDAEFAENTWDKLAEKYNFEVGENGKVIFKDLPAR